MIAFLIVLMIVFVILLTLAMIKVSGDASRAEEMGLFRQEEKHELQQK